MLLPRLGPCCTAALLYTCQRSFSSAVLLGHRDADGVEVASETAEVVEPPGGVWLWKNPETVEAQVNHVESRHSAQQALWQAATPRSALYQPQDYSQALPAAAGATGARAGAGATAAGAMHGLQDPGVHAARAPPPLHPKRELVLVPPSLGSSGDRGDRGGGGVVGAAARLPGTPPHRPSPPPWRGASAASLHHASAGAIPAHAAGARYVVEPEEEGGEETLPAITTTAAVLPAVSSTTAAIPAAIAGESGTKAGEPQVPLFVSQLAAIVAAGSTRLEVKDTSGFHVGDKIQIGEAPPGHGENRTVTGFGSLLLDVPLQGSYPAGTFVRVVEPLQGTKALAPAPKKSDPSENLTCMKSEEAVMLVGSVIVFGLLTVVCLCVLLGIWCRSWGREAGEFNCRVISEKKVGVLREPDITSEVFKYIEAGTIFTAVTRVVPSDGRAYYLLQNKSGWVPECSRKDASRPVITVQTKQGQKPRRPPPTDYDDDDDNADSSSGSR